MIASTIGAILWPASLGLVPDRIGRERRRWICKRTAGGWKWLRAAEIHHHFQCAVKARDGICPGGWASLPGAGLEAQVGGLEVPGLVEGRRMIRGVPGVDFVAKRTAAASGRLGDGGVELLGSHVGRA